VNAPFKFAPVKFAFVRFESWMDTPSIVACVKFALLAVTLDKFAYDTFALVRFALVRILEPISNPFKFAFVRFAFVKFVVSNTRGVTPPSPTKLTP